LTLAVRQLYDLLPTTPEGEMLIRVCYEAAKRKYEELTRR
jgi:hypothetical protein